MNETPGVLGESAPLGGKYNAALTRRAIRNRWPIRNQLRRKIVEQMELVVETAASARDKTAAAKVLMAADAINVNRERIDKPQATPSVNVAVGVNAELPRSIVSVPDSRLLEFLHAAGSADGTCNPEVQAAPSANGVLPAFAAPSTNGVSGKH